MAGNISSQPRDWGGGHRYTQFDMDELEVRKVRALERIADALDGRQTSKWSGSVAEGSKKSSKPSGGSGSIFDCFKS